MESFKKVLPYLLVAIVFAVGGYFIGAGALSNQGAALYKSGAVLNPCDNSPTNPCPGNALIVNQNCQSGTQFINGKCVPSMTVTTKTGTITYIAKSSVDTGPAGMTQADWENMCHKMWGGTGQLNENNWCVKGAIRQAPGGASTAK